MRGAHQWMMRRDRQQAPKLLFSPSPSQESRLNIDQASTLKET